MFFFTADEHYWHNNIIKYCNRPFKSVTHMNEELICRHNEVVGLEDTTVHAGDFTLCDENKAKLIIARLNGKHIFLMGSHDRWLGRNHPLQIWETRIEGQVIVVCHYAMRRWAKSHHGSWHIFGHSHGTLEPEGKSLDIGVDNHDFYPVSFEKLKRIMDKRPLTESIRKK